MSAVLSKLDPGQVLQSVYDENGALRISATGTLPVSGSLTVTLGDLTVVDHSDSPLIAASSINPASGSLVTVVASLAADAKKIALVDTVGFHTGLYIGGQLKIIVGPGSDSVYELAAPAGTVVEARYLENVSPTAGTLSLTFFG